MQACGIARHLGLVTEMLLERANQGVPPALIYTTHPADVSFQMPVVEKVGERGLLEQRRVAVGMPLGAREGLDQVGRHDQISNPQAREHHVREGPEKWLCSGVHFARIVRAWTSR